MEIIRKYQDQFDVNNTVIGALGTITKGLFKGLENLEFGGRVEMLYSHLHVHAASQRHNNKDA